MKPQCHVEPAPPLPAQAKWRPRTEETVICCVTYPARGLEGGRQERFCPEQGCPFLLIVATSFSIADWPWFL